MDRRRSRSVACVTALAAIAAHAAPAAAQPAGDAAGDAIEMEPEPAPAPSPADAAAAPAPEAEAPPAPVKDPKLARRWLAAGRKLVQKGDWLTRAKKPDDAKAAYENAVIAYEKALEASDDLSPHVPLAEVYGKLGKPDLATRHYRAVVKAPEGVQAAVLKKASAGLEAAAAQVGIVTLSVTPEGASISLAGAELGKAPLAEPLILMPGTYTIALQAEGFQPKETEIVVEAGSESERAIELEAVRIVVQPPAVDDEPVTPPPPPPSGPSRAPLYVGGGLAVLAIGAATVTGILAVGEHGTYTDRDSTPDQRADAKSSGERLALISDLSLATGVVAGGFTAYWYFFKYRPAQRARGEARPATAAAKVDVVPWVQGRTGGFSLVGAF